MPLISVLCCDLLVPLGQEGEELTGDRESTSVVPAANVMPTPPHPLDGEWYVHLEGETYGPYSGHVIRGFIADGRITPETDVMRTGRSDWTDAASDKALAPLFAGQPLLGSPKAPPVKSRNVAAAQGATVVQVTNNLAPPERSFAAAVLVEDGPAAPNRPVRRLSCQSSWWGSARCTTARSARAF